jgi:alpha-galactosidase
MSAETRGILTNKEMIAIDQDSLGFAAFKMDLPDSLEVWVKPLKNSGLALCFFNRTATSGKLNLAWKDLVIKDDFSGVDIHFDKQTYSYKDLWQKQSVYALTNKNFTRELAPHAVIVLRLAPAK